MTVEEYLSLPKDNQYTLYQIHDTCPYCGKKFITQARAIKKRIDNGNSHLVHACGKCYRRIVCFNTPIELLQYSNSNPVPYDVYKKYYKTYSCKMPVKIRCLKCKKETTVRWDKMSQRDYFTGDPFCQKCILKIITNTVDWREKNSDAQYIAQNKPEVKKKQKEIQQKKINEDFDEYVMSHSNRRKILRGTYNDIDFVGSYELAFLHYSAKHGMNVCRANGVKIPYLYNGEQHFYQPDFIIKAKKIYLVEVKGIKNALVDAKVKAAEEFIKQDNNVFDEYILFDDLMMSNTKCIHRINNIKKLNMLGKVPIVIHNFPPSWEATWRCRYPCVLQK